MDYEFRHVEVCDMCGAGSRYQKIMGQRLSASQGLRPRKTTGVGTTIMRCRECGLVYTNPQPVPRSLEDHYGKPPEDYWSRLPEIREGALSSQIETARRLLDQKSQIKALDIGAGLGQAMNAMDKAGFDTWGLEPSPNFRARAVTSGVNPDRLKVARVEEVVYPDRHFDFITYGAVFEHLTEPSRCLSRSLKWLRQGGIIHIEVPSSRWLISRIVNLYYRAMGTTYVTNLSPMHSPYHLFEFGLASFELASRRLGYDIAEYRYDVCDVMFAPAPAKAFLRRIMDATDTGMQLTVYLRKTG